jgi:hypothetical protein
MNPKFSTILTAGALALSACDTGSVTDPGQAGATVSGRIESTLSGGIAAAPSLAQQSATSMNAASVAVAALRSNGALEVLAEAQVQADGRFSIDNVRAGQTNLIVSARDAAGAKSVDRSCTGRPSSERR